MLSLHKGLVTVSPNIFLVGKRRKKTKQNKKKQHLSRFRYFLSKIFLAVSTNPAKCIGRSSADQSNDKHSQELLKGDQGKMTEFGTCDKFLGLGFLEAIIMMAPKSPIR